LIASRHDWHRSKGLLKGFKLALSPWESLKNWWRYDQMKFVTKRSNVDEYKVGDLVMLSTKDLKYQMARKKTEVDREICWSLQNQGNSIIKRGQIRTT